MSSLLLVELQFCFVKIYSVLFKLCNLRFTEQLLCKNSQSFEEGSMEHFLVNLQDFM